MHGFRGGDVAPIPDVSATPPKRSTCLVKNSPTRLPRHASWLVRRGGRAPVASAPCSELAAARPPASATIESVRSRTAPHSPHRASSSHVAGPHTSSDANRREVTCELKYPPRLAHASGLHARSCPARRRSNDQTHIPHHAPCGLHPLSLQHGVSAPLGLPAAMHTGALGAHSCRSCPGCVRDTGLTVTL